MRSFLDNIVALLTCHWLAMAGTALTTASAALFVSLMFGGADNPYVGILLFLVLPALFVLGLILLPIGLYRKSREVGGFGAILSPVTRGEGATARLVILVLAATGANIAMVSTTSVQGLDYMESATFCGAVCHSVMEPQFVAYQESPHAEIGCVECHVADSTASFVYHKIDGIRQVASLITNSYDRPIPSSGGRMHAAEETCGSCHRMDPTGEGESLRVIRSFADDETNTPQTTVLMLHTRRVHQAHSANRIQYVPEDESLQSIPWLSADGVVYASGERPAGEPRTMDCIDCHNRTGHDFPPAEVGVDRALANGEIDRSTPFAKRDSLVELTDDSPSPLSPTLDAIRNRSNFPQMQVSWDTYPNNIGHTGCFRCHSTDHVTDGGDAVGRGCLSCHSMLAVASPNPTILSTLGITEP